MAHTLGEKPNIRPYIMVFVALMTLTLITVAVSYLHLPTMEAIALALLIATVKASLVACYFMHLMTERKLILWTLLLSAVFFFFVLVIPTMTAGNPITL
ncbi:MAG: cytochrome C oxidase subunit IV family protein [Thermoanaerobaculia bacterium]|nr:cytochrome C oxidase subunit IV family protein [Thermoanaerobaculia bacterium]